MGFDKDKFLKDGFIFLENYYEITPKHIELSNHLMKDYNYKIGRRYVCNSPDTLPILLKNIIMNKEISSFFNSLEEDNLSCRDVMLTHEFKHDIMERNKWLHFDRWRSYKAMVYLTDVDYKDGPFSVVPRTHSKGKKLRREFANLRYENRPNRIKLDYPDLFEDPVALTGGAGTLILFDSDIFHLGGDVKEGHNRKLIRSHWYSDKLWRERS